MSCSMLCPHCNEWASSWKGVERDKPKQLFDIWECNCGGRSVWFMGAPMPIAANKVDTNLEWKI